jgi:hypothetical protein
MTRFALGRTFINDLNRLLFQFLKDESSSTTMASNSKGTFSTIHWMFSRLMM